MNRLPASASSHTPSASSSQTHSSPAKSSTNDEYGHLLDGWSNQSGDELDRAWGRIADRVAPISSPAQHAVFAPMHYEKGYSYPLLIWLHSQGGSEHELRQVMPHVSVRNYVAAAVRGAKTSAASQRSQGFCWRQSIDDTAEAADQVRRCIDQVSEQYNIHPDRIFLAGYEEGGTMALRVGLAHPEWFAGVASLEGPMPRGNSPLLRVNEARELPLLLAACRDSQIYAEGRVAEDLRLLHSAGFSLALRQYPGDHDLTTEMLADLNRWIMEQFSSATIIR
ncbi:MAG: hypothetical protein KDA61_10200 [Planctomycetales bacterium]|nr:hypothetical protein [Planctomycetales bacterium]